MELHIGFYTFSVEYIFIHISPPNQNVYDTVRTRKTIILFYNSWPSPAFSPSASYNI